MGGQVFVHHHALGGSVAGGSGGDDPTHPWLSLKSAHEMDAVASWREKLADMAAAGERAARYPCPLCDRHFPTEKAVHGHMRSHPGRGWRGMEPPREPSPGDLAADGKWYRYVCDRCKAPFETRQALGGHRASHSSKKGCSWHAKQRAMEMAEAAAKPPKNDFDLNDLSLEAIQAAQEEEAAAAAEEEKEDKEPNN
uniref:C2H2-type domain-containing protein n=1 Tax=Oryza punctata TaxID=4537 RepID=A0A0E0LFV6_ORYPU